MASWEDAYPDAAEVWQEAAEGNESQNAAQSRWDDDPAMALIDFTGVKWSVEVERFANELIADGNLMGAMEPIIVNGLANIYEER